MKNTVLLQELYRIKEAHDVMNFDIDFLRFIDKVKNEIQLEKADETNDKKRVQSALKIIKDKFNSGRPILQESVIRNGKQYFTNSYMLVELNEPIKALESHENDEIVERYPVLERVISDKQKNDQYIIFNVSQLKTNIKLLKKDDPFIVFDDSEKCLHLESKYILYAIDILKFKNSDEIKLYYRKNEYNKNILTVTHIENEFGLVLIVPMRKKEEKTE